MSVLSVDSRAVLVESLIRDEGFRQYPYYDSGANLTVGIGRNLDSNGITLNEAKYLCNNDIDNCEKEVMKLVKNYGVLDNSRKMVLLNMCFNLGINKFSEFRKMIAFVEINDFELAAQEIRNSKAYKDLTSRYARMAHQMETGK